MGTRTPSSVTSDLMTIGVERSVAESVAAGAGMKGHDAKVFVKANKDLVSIDIHQESALLDRIVARRLLGPGLWHASSSIRR